MTLTATPDVAATQPPSAPAPDARLAGIDLARGIAMLGMVTVHVSISGSQTLPDAAQWALSAPSGRSAVLFFLLSGVTVSLIAGRGSASTAPAVLRRRGLVLLGIGFLAIHTFWPNSILHSYGVMFLLAPWFLQASRRVLLIIAAAAFTLGPLAITLLNRSGGSGKEDAVVERGSVVSFLGTDGLGTLVGQYALVVWVGFFVVGVVLGRLQLTSRKVAAALLLGGVATCAVWTLGVEAVTPLVTPDIGGTPVAVEADPTPTPTPTPTPSTQPSMGKVPAADDTTDGAKGIDGGSQTGDEPSPKDGSPLTDAPGKGKAAKQAAPLAVGAHTFLSLTPHSSSTAWAVQSLAVAVAVLGACLLIPASLGRWLWPIRAVGTVSLTIYLLHIFFVTDVWKWLLDGKEPPVWMELAALAGLLATLVIVAVVIRRFWSRGPAEWVLGQLSRPR